MVLRGKCPQTASNNSHCPKFCPGCIHYVRGSGVLLADESVFTISTLQVVVCAGDGHLHRALGTPSVTVQSPRPPPRRPQAAQQRGARSQRQPRKTADPELTEVAEAAGVSRRAGLPPCDTRRREALNLTKQSLAQVSAHSQLSPCDICCCLDTSIHPVRCVQKHKAVPSW